MSKRVKHVCLVIAAQAVCLAVGLWMQYRFVVTSTKAEATEHAWIELEQSAQSILKYFDGVSAPHFEAETIDVVHLRRQAASAVSQATGVCIVDQDWNVLFNEAPAFPVGAPDFPVGTRLSWTAELSPDAEPTQTSRGVFEGPSGAQFAVAHALKNLNGHLVVHIPQAVAEARTASILSSRPAIGWLTWLWTTVLLGISSYMVLARFHDESERERARSLAEGAQQRQKLLRTRDAVIFGLAKLADSRDPETGDHLERISVYSTMLATVLRHHPKYASQATPAFVGLIGISSVLHDIGKVGIEDRILLKPGPLTADERARIQEHAAIGGDCLREIEQRLGSSNFLQMAREIAFAHHERWDGTGYPNGLKGEAIPLAARIVSVVDVYDALSSRRVYKGPRKHEECVSIIREAAGTQFDPDLIAVWLKLEGKFREIARRYANEAPALPPVEPRSTAAAEEVEYAVEKECLV